jgi:2-iminobutanoate/2-iminopropanoate deaminase
MSKAKVLNIAAIFSFAFGLTAILWNVLPTPGDAAADKSRKIAVETADAPKAIGPYSQAIIADDFVFVAGQIGIDPKTGNLVAGGVEAETAQVLKNLEAVLKAGKSDFDGVVKATIFLADMNDFAKVNEIYARYFKAPFPARATVQVARLPRDARVEIELTAMVKK